MQAASRRTDSEEPVSPPTSRLLTHIEGLEASIEGLDEWWEAGLEIATEVNSPELRKKFLGMVKGAREAKRQVCALNLDDIDWTHSYTPTHFLQYAFFCVYLFP